MPKTFTGIFNGRFDRGEFYPFNPTDHEKYIQQHDGVEMTVEYKPTAKSSEKERLYAFYHRVILSITIQALEEAGYTGVDKVVADAYIKQSVAQELVYNKKGDVVMKYSADKRDMDKERLRKLIQDAIFLLLERHEKQVPDAQEYKDLKNYGIIFERAK